MYRKKAGASASDPGYREHESSGLVLPANVVDDLIVQEHKALIAESETRERQDAERRSRLEAELAARPRPSMSNADDGFSITDEEFGECPPGHLRVFSVKELSPLVHQGELRISNPSDRKGMLTRAKALKRLGPFRPLAPLPSNWRERFIRLRMSMPNFASALEALACEFVLHRNDDDTCAIPRLPPIVLVGPPGVGKSVFAQAFAEILEVPHYRLSMETVGVSDALDGCDAHWANSSTGLIHDSLVLGRVGNPVLVLEEIDKCPRPDRHVPGWAPLLSLLEPHSAADFRDQSIRQLRLDASRINFIATANDVRDMPAPLLSRFHVVDVPPFSAQQARHVAAAIYAEIIARLPPSIRDNFEPLSDGIAEHVARMAPRRMKMVLRNAIGRAVLYERRSLNAEDIVRGSTSAESNGGLFI